MVQTTPVKDNDADEALLGGQKVTGEKFETVVLGGF
jgi:hypothetical protein